MVIAVDTLIKGQLDVRLAMTEQSSGQKLQSCGAPRVLQSGENTDTC